MRTEYYNIKEQIDIKTHIYLSIFDGNPELSLNYFSLQRSPPNTAIGAP